MLAVDGLALLIRLTAAWLRSSPSPRVVQDTELREAFARGWLEFEAKADELADEIAAGVAAEMGP